MALTAEDLELLRGDISDAVDPSLERTDVQVNANLVRAADGNADQYAADRKLGQETGVSTDIASRNRPQLEKLKYLDELDLQALRETPVTQEWLKNDENAKIAYDDIAVLQKFERESDRTWWEAGEKAFENFGKSSLLGLGKAWDGIALAVLNEAKEGQGPGSVASMERFEQNLNLTDEQKAKREVWKEEAAANREKLIGERRLSMEKAEKEIGRLTPRGMTVMEESIRGGMQMGIDFAPGLIVSAVTRGRINPTLALMGVKVYGESYSSAILEGLDHKTAMRYATIDTVIEIATERFPVKRLEGVVGDLGGKSVKSWMKRFLFEDIVGEQAAALGQTMNAYAHDLDEELANARDWKEMMDIQGRRQAVALISTMIGGGSIAGTVKSVDYLASREQRAMTKLMSDTNKRRGSEFDQKRLDSLISLSQASKTNERAADVFQELVDKMDPDQQIYMDAEAVELLDNPPAYLVEQMVDGSGGTVSMPLSTFLKDFANDDKLMEIVRPFIKTNEKHHNQTETEQEDDSDYIKTILAKAAETQETKSTADAIYEQVTDQLIATGQLSAASARQAAALVPAQVTVQYEYLKSTGYKNEDGSEVTLEQVFATIGLEIVGPQVDVAAVDFINQDDVPDSQKPLVSGLALLPSADQETIQAAAFQSPDGSVGDNTQLMDFFARKAGYKNATEYNAAVRQQDEAYDALLQDPAQLMLLANNPEMALNMDIGEAYKTIALAVANKRGLRILRDRAEVQQLEDSLADATPEELTSIIANEFQDTAEILDFPRVLKQQNFSTIELVEDRVDAAGNALTITENAGELWDQQQERMNNIEKLRNCLRG
jgi:hypothetical protein